MKVIERYIAKDGKEFNDREECAKYEFALELEEHNLFNRLVLYNDRKEKVEISDEEGWADVCCIIARDGDAIGEYYDITLKNDIDCTSRYVMYQLFESPAQGDSGVWLYDWNTDKWNNLNYEIDKLQGQLNYWMEEVG